MCPCSEVCTRVFRSRHFPHIPSTTIFAQVAIFASSPVRVRFLGPMRAAREHESGSVRPPAHGSHTTDSALHAAQLPLR